jgi:hypothetical protein
MYTGDWTKLATGTTSYWYSIMTDFTSNFNLELVPFDTDPWHTKEHNNWHIVDAIMKRYITISNVQGVWTNATTVTVGDRYIDVDADTIWEVLVPHVTKSTGLFAADRVANPTYWQGVTVDSTSRGTWTVGTAYITNDYVVDVSGGYSRYGIVITNHTAVTSYDTGVTDNNIITLINVKATSLDPLVYDTVIPAVTTTVMFAPATANGSALGGASNEWSDLFLSDEAVIYFGADQDVTLTHVHDTGLTLNGDLTAGTLNADSDTSVGQNAAMGYTLTEGLILTGQGSTDDITIKNDADTTVVNVATGGTDVEISAGNLLFGTGSKGVYLGVTTATAANLLDDYEEGTWTASLTGGSGAPTAGIQTTTATYVKIGRIVQVAIYYSAVDLSGASGTVEISGFPFAFEERTQLQPAFKHQATSSGAYNVWYGGVGDTTMIEYYVVSNGDWVTQSIRSAANQYYLVSGTYRTAS